MRWLSGAHVTSLSPAFDDVMRCGFALPSDGTIQRSDTTSFSSYDGSVTEKTTHLPSGLGSGAPTRFIRKSVSCVSGCFVCANAAAATSNAMTALIRIRCIFGLLNDVFFADEH